MDLRPRNIFLFFAILWISFPATIRADRERVLKQIDVPHPYYYREMYLPQLTSGPSSMAWSPDSKTLVYSMQGSLWKQLLDSEIAVQLTDGPGYDYQPDWSPDGKWIIFTRYNNDALELYLLEVQSGQAKQLTTKGAVNIEPRFSPDGKKLAFVSTASDQRFHIFLGSLRNGTIEDIERLAAEHQSKVSRYYYSLYDHEISPAWSPDSSEIIFISNRETAYGTGGIWRMKAEPGSQARLIHSEETTWKARPAWLPDGKRIILSSYLGNQWHQLWIVTAEGENPYPLSYGDFDVTSARPSPDGKKIAFISNKDGGLSLWIQEVIGGSRRPLVIGNRRYLRPRAQVQIKIFDPEGKPTTARVSMTGEDGRFYAPSDAWIHADDGFDRTERRFEAHYFHLSGAAEVNVPAGKIAVEVMRGFEYKFEHLEIALEPAQKRQIVVNLKDLPLPKNWGRWLSGDLHVHMNYGGSYRNTPGRLIAQAEAENVRVVFNLIVNKEVRMPDVSYFSAKPDPASTPGTILLHSQEFHTSYWGHLGLLNLQRNLLIPGYSAYPYAAAASLFPTNAAVADLAHDQGALVGYVHPFEAEPDPAKDSRLTSELPVDVALGKIDYYEVLGFSDHKASAAVWYRLLNCGFRLPAGAGTDAMANYASPRGPVGMNRVYVNLDGPLEIDRWLKAFRSGQSFATNGPLLNFTLNGHGPGDEISLPAGKHTLNFTASLCSMVPVDHLQIVFNGKIIRDLKLEGERTSGDFEGSLGVDGSGWLVLRAWSDKAIHPVQDNYPYATTSPVYIAVGNKPLISANDASYFIAWVDRLIKAARNHTGYNAEAEKADTLKTLSEARAIFEEQLNQDMPQRENP